MREITSASNSEIKALVSLRRSAAERRRTRLFLIEGERMVWDARTQRLLEQVYVTRKVYDRLGGGLNMAIPEGNITILSEEAMAKASDTKTPQGILAAARQPSWDLQQILEDMGGDGLLLILEDIQDPGNLGTMFRTAEAAGADGILLSAGCADVFNPKTVRATMSSIFEVPFCRTDDLPAAIAFLREKPVKVHAAALHGGGVDYTVPRYRMSTAFVIGNEARGLREETILAADDTVFIPMQGRIESLNAAMSAGILLYEAARQRRAAGVL